MTLRSLLSAQASSSKYNNSFFLIKHDIHLIFFHSTVSTYNIVRITIVININFCVSTYKKKGNYFLVSWDAEDCHERQ